MGRAARPAINAAVIVIFKGFIVKSSLFSGKNKLLR
jgi:hypothetical protein